jgi:hypothetical protein
MATVTELQEAISSALEEGGKLPSTIIGYTFLTSCLGNRSYQTP